MASPEITLTHLDEPLFDGAGATKRDLVDYLEAVADRIVPVLRGRPLSVIRVRAGQRPFMQKNVPDYAPPWVKTVSMWAESSHRQVRYALCEDKPTLIWFANQRAVEYHVTLGTAGHLDRPSYLVLDIDPPTAGEFGRAVAAARLVREALSGAGLAGAVKTSGAKGVHIYVPVQESVSADDAAAATRAMAERAARLDPGLATTAFIKADRGGKVFIDSTRAHGATVVAAYSPRGALACRSRSRWPGTRWTRCRPGTSRCGTRRGCWRTLIPGPLPCRRRRRCRKTSSRRATRSRSPAYRPCTRASAAPSAARPLLPDKASPRSGRKPGAASPSRCAA